MERPIEPRDVEIDADKGLRVRSKDGLVFRLSARAARTLALKMLATWPERAEDEPERESGEFFECRFCGCHTNAHVRACCELGRAKDLGRVTDEQLARWEEEADQWLDRGAGEGSVVGYNALVRLLAGRVVLLVEELGWQQKGCPGPFNCPAASSPEGCRCRGPGRVGRFV